MDTLISCLIQSRKKGSSAEEAWSVHYVTEKQASQATMTPQESLVQTRKGNTRDDREAHVVCEIMKKAESRRFALLKEGTALSIGSRPATPMAEIPVGCKFPHLLFRIECE